MRRAIFEWTVLAVCFAVALAGLTQLFHEEAYACFGLCGDICDGVPGTTQCNCSHTAPPCIVRTCATCPI